MVEDHLVVVAIFRGLSKKWDDRAPGKEEQVVKWSEEGTMSNFSSNIAGYMSGLIPGRRMVVERV